jgi:hypothetical protein
MFDRWVTTVGSWIGSHLLARAFVDTVQPDGCRGTKCLCICLTYRCIGTEGVSCHLDLAWQLHNCSHNQLLHRRAARNAALTVLASLS